MASTIVAHSLQEIRNLSPRRSAVTLGVFDGVHLGHREIIKELVRSKKRETVDGCYLITFDPHPLVVTHSKMTPPMLTTIDERIELLHALDIDGIVVLKFDERLADVDYRAFLEQYMQKPFDMKHLVIGYDCFFGKNRQGSPDKAVEEGRRLGFEVKVVGALSEGEEVVSSTNIRNALMEGDLTRANRLLGHPYLLSGTVIKGAGKGRDLGFPTANLAIQDPYKLWPPRGVYAVRVAYEGRTLDGMMNVGTAPTIKEKSEDSREVEVHLFDFDEDTYGARLMVYCHAYLRAEKRFPSPEALIRQLEADRTNAAQCLERGC